MSEQTETRLKELIRESQFPSQRAFARAIGVGDAELSRWVTGRIKPIPIHQQRVARRLGVKPEDIWPLATTKEEA